MTTEKILEANKLLVALLGLNSITDYRKSGMFDIKGVEILEGSVINANGYNSDLKDEVPNFHCVEYCDGQFGSDIYSDFEPLARYNKIEVVGHCTQFIDLFDVEDGWSGNLGAAMKIHGYSSLKFHSSWAAQIPVYGAFARLFRELAVKDEQAHQKYLKLLDKHGDAVFNNQPLEGFAVIAENAEWYNQHKHLLKTPAVQ